MYRRKNYLQAFCVFHPPIGGAGNGIGPPGPGGGGGGPPITPVGGGGAPTPGIGGGGGPIPGIGGGGGPIPDIGGGGGPIPGNGGGGGGPIPGIGGGGGHVPGNDEARGHIPGIGGGGGAIPGIGGGGGGPMPAIGGGGGPIPEMEDNGEPISGIDGGEWSIPSVRGEWDPVLERSGDVRSLVDCWFISGRDAGEGDSAPRPEVIFESVDWEGKEVGKVDCGQELRPSPTICTRDVWTSDPELVVVVIPGIGCRDKSIPDIGGGGGGDIISFTSDRVFTTEFKSIVFVVVSPPACGILELAISRFIFSVLVIMVGNGSVEDVFLDLEGDFIPLLFLVIKLSGKLGFVSLVPFSITFSIILFSLLSSVSCLFSILGDDEETISGKGCEGVEIGVLVFEISLESICFTHSFMFFISLLGEPKSLTTLAVNDWISDKVLYFSNSCLSCDIVSSSSLILASLGDGERAISSFFGDLSIGRNSLQGLTNTSDGHGETGGHDSVVSFPGVCGIEAGASVCAQ